MRPPKCRICGMREFGHRCQVGEENARDGGSMTPAEAVFIARTLTVFPLEDRRGNLAARDGRSDASRAGGSGPPPETVHLTLDEQKVMHKALRRSTRPAWTDDTDAAGEPIEVRERTSRPARFYAPPGSCVYCDRRRAAAAKTMRAVRERGEA